MVRKGRTKENVAGERYDSNAMPVAQPTPSRTRPHPGQFNPADLMGMLGEGTPTSSFMTFYPNYIDNKKTVQQGRRIPKQNACEAPIADEMSEVCTYFKLPHVLEPAKKYPRDWLVSGRIRVRLVRDDGSPENPDIPNRKTLMIKMAELIPKLQSRKVRLEKEAEEAKKKAAAAAGAVTTSSGGGKKKGKKKGRR
ncbi:hypothetical protein JG687_00014592 [Phytophthora cactorum]|uniref:Signal recognition particle, SRP19 subunit n=1 Tax=Phytophthora cactorum TaxID=29920 RepID=A0A8T1U165_9STRA|nr:hypothetical protein JG687_00014592 [Phytophthora cactorum]